MEEDKGTCDAAPVNMSGEATASAGGTTQDSCKDWEDSYSTAVFS